MRSAACLVIIALVSIGSAVANTPGEPTLEAQALLAFAVSAGAVNLSNWTNTNLNNVCVDWQGVQCNSDGRVIALRLPDFQFNGTFSSALLTLTQLQVLDLGKATNLFGTIPPEFFQLPDLIRVVLSKLPVSIRLPTVVSQSIRDLNLEETNLSGALPDFSWRNMTRFDFSGSQLECPLPQGLVDFFEQQDRFVDCAFRNTKVFVDRMNRICGQIRVSRTPCLIYPTAADFDPPPSQPQFRDRASNFTIILEYDTFYLLGTYSFRNGTRADYTSEYFAVRLSPLRLTVRNTEKITFETTGFQNFVWNADKTILRSNSTLTSRQLGNSVVIQEFLLYTSAPPRTAVDTNNPRIKFSLKLYNVNTTWPSNIDPVTTTLVVLYRAAHSEETTSLLRCTGLDFFQTCKSSVADLVFRPGTDGAYDSEFRTASIRLEYSYAAVGNSDGTPLNIFNTEFRTLAIVNPVGRLDFLNAINSAGLASSFPAGPLSNQGLLISTEVSFPKFVSSAEYDPDLSLRLLFSPETGEPPLTAAEVAGLSAGIIAAIVIVIVVAIGGATVFAVFVFPYLKQRQESARTRGTDDIDLVDNSVSNQGRWATAEPTQRKADTLSE